MAYYVLQSPVGPGEVLADFEPYSDYTESWQDGQFFKKEPPDPIRLVWDPDHESGTRSAFYDIDVTLLRKDVVRVLQNEGVDNLAVYNVEISSTQNQEICKDYVAVKIVGLVAAADMDQSVIIDPSDGIVDVFFESLVIDESMANGQLMFRLAENVSAILVHERIAVGLRSAGGFGLTLTPPADFCG